MDTLVKMRGREDNPWGDEMLMEDICFIRGEQRGGCIRTRSFTGHPYRPKYWWVVDWDIAVLSIVEVS